MLLVIQKLFLDRPIGLLSLVDEESHFPQGTDRTLAEKFQHHFRKNSLLQCSIQPFANANSTYSLEQNLRFSIRHFAGLVYYDVTGFLDKNRDSLPGTRNTQCLTMYLYLSLITIYIASVGLFYCRSDRFGFPN